MKIIIIEDATPEEARAFMNNLEKKKQDLIGRLAFTRILKEKGYKRASSDSLRSTCQEFGIDRVKRGKEYWYPSSQVENIPSKN